MDEVRTAAKKPSFLIRDILSNELKKNENTIQSCGKVNNMENEMCEEDVKNVYENYSKDVLLSWASQLNNMQMCFYNLSMAMRQKRIAEIQHLHIWNSKYHHEAKLDEVRFCPYQKKMFAHEKSKCLLDVPKIDSKKLRKLSTESNVSSPITELEKLTETTLSKWRDRDDLNRIFGQKQISNKRRKSRTAFSTHQLNELENRFSAQKYLTPADRDDIANKLNLTAAQVITWFQNRRAKLKRDVEEMKNDLKAVVVEPVEKHPESSEQHT